VSTYHRSCAQASKFNLDGRSKRNTVTSRAFQGKKKLGEPNRTVLIPEKPCADVEERLDSFGILWPTGSVFLDDASGQFTRLALRGRHGLVCRT